MSTPGERRRDAEAKFSLRFTEEFPEVCVLYDGTPIVMIRSASIGVAEDSMIEDLSEHAPPEGRFELFSWDNDGPDGEWTGNLTAPSASGRPQPLWESSLTWPSAQATRLAQANGFETIDAAVEAGRCARHPGFDRDNCPGCGTSSRMETP